jgi:hypothetical protein
MPLHRPQYLVEYDPTEEPITVVVSTGDMLRAELELAKLKLAPTAAMHVTALWLWSALVRAGREERRAGEFIADPPEFEPIKDDVAVDPTRAALGATGSA